MSRILITGGKGYIGTYLAEYFSKQGDEVFITSRKVSSEDYNVRHMDLLDDSTIAGVCKDIDIVIHTANFEERKISGNEKDALLANAYSTRSLYQEAAKQGVKRFIYFSTFHIYGRENGTIDESTDPLPVRDYGLTHLFAEKYLYAAARTSDTKVDIIRLTNGIGAPIGADKWYLVLNDFCKMVFESQKIEMKSNGLVIRDFVPIEDVTKAVDCIIKANVDSMYEIYNVSGQMTYSIRDLAELVCQQYEKRYNEKMTVSIPAVTEKERSMVKPLYVSSEKIRRLGWKNETTVETVINRIFTYLEECKSEK